MCVQMEDRFLNRRCLKVKMVGICEFHPGPGINVRSASIPFRSIHYYIFRHLLIPRLFCFFDQKSNIQIRQVTKMDCSRGTILEK